MRENSVSLSSFCLNFLHIDYIDNGILKINHSVTAVDSARPIMQFPSRMAFEPRFKANPKWQKNTRGMLSSYSIEIIPIYISMVNEMKTGVKEEKREARRSGISERGNRGFRGRNVPLWGILGPEPKWVNHGNGHRLLIKW